MRLRTQVILGLSVVGVLVLAVIFGGVGPYLSRTFSSIEQGDVAQNVERIRNVLLTEISNLEAISHDWGAWDETFDFAQGTHPDYVEENVTEDTLANLQMSLMAYYDPSGQLIYSAGYDLDEEELRPPSDALLSAAAALAPDDRADDDVCSIAGLVAFDHQLMMVAVHPILNNDHEPPASGTLILGRVVSAGVVGRLSTLVQLPMTIHALDDPAVDPDVTDSLSNGVGDGEYVLQPIDRDTVRGYALLDDLYGNAIALLGIDVPRDAVLAGVAAIQSTMFTIVVTFLVLGSALLYFLNHRVLAPMTQLTRDVSHIGERGDLSARVSVQGADELSTLGRNINGMLSALEESRTALAQSERQYRNLFETSHDPIYITGEDGRFIDVNQALVDLFGYTRDELMAMKAGDLYDRPEERDAFRAAIQKEGFVASYPVTLLKRGGEPARCLLTTIVETLPGTNEAVYQGIIRDVTELLRQQEKLTYLATHDPLTGLLTRGALDDRLRLEIARAMRNLDRLAVFYLDLVRFKEVNDTHGHAAGDRVLQEVANKLRDSLRASDSVARLGGDEFVALLPGIDSPKDAEFAADKILSELRDAFGSAEQARGLSVSIGIALYPDDADDPDHLLQRADSAMYSAKSDGRDAWKRYIRRSADPSPS